MNKDELKSILEQHRLWIVGNGGKRADLRGADLDYSNLPLWCGSSGTNRNIGVRKDEPQGSRFRTGRGE